LDTLEGEGSWLLPPQLPPPQLPPAAAAAAAAEGGLMHLWEPTRSKGSACLELQLVCQLGKGGFGSVHKVAVKARGSNSLADLRLDGPLGTSLHAIMSRAKAAAAAARVHQRGTAAHGGSNGSSGSSGGAVSMALKLALPFERLSYEMQRNFKTAAVYDANVQVGTAAAAALRCVRARVCRSCSLASSLIALLPPLHACRLACATSFA
jgi:hypothetical protein